MVYTLAIVVLTLGLQTFFGGRGGAAESERPKQNPEALTPKELLEKAAKMKREAREMLELSSSESSERSKEAEEKKRGGKKEASCDMKISSGSTSSQSLRSCFLCAALLKSHPSTRPNLITSTSPDCCKKDVTLPSPA